MEMAGIQSDDGWRQKLILKLARDKGCPYTAARILLYFASILAPGQSRVFTHAELMTELAIPVKANISDSLKILEERGYITRHLSRNDGRSKEIELLSPDKD